MKPVRVNHARFLDRNADFSRNHAVGQASRLSYVPNRMRRTTFDCMDTASVGET